VLMAFTTSILSIPGEKYRTLTTSDSGWFYDLAVDIDKTDGMVENNRLSHAPYGMPVGVTDQGQPLMAVMLYRAIHAVNSNITLMDVVQHWSLLLFALSLIPIFLIGKELGGDLAGCLAAFFAAFLTSSIYWTKFGSFDREATQLVLGVWTTYLTIRLFKAPRGSIPTFAILAGSVYGIFVSTWGVGALYLAPVIIGGLALVLLVGFAGKLVRKTADLIRSAFLTIRENLYLIVGAAGMLVVMTLMFYVGGGDPIVWKGFAQTLLSYVGIGGGGGISFSRYAGEAQAPGSWGDVFGRFYDMEVLNAIVLVLVALALIKICMSRKRWELLVIPWFIIVAGMVWPGRGQARFERLWWPLIPVLAGVGFVAMVSILRQASLKIPSAAGWLDRIQKPIVIAVCAILVAAPFIQNAYATAEQTTPPTMWTGIPNFDNELISSFDWLRENTPENSVVAVEWSYGHLATGISRRMTVCDGTETLAEEGKWENTAAIRPPDYIYYVRDSTGIIYGVDVPARPWTINGRRTDIQRLPLMDEREFRWLVQTYRDNYKCQIDYVIFYNAWVTPGFSYFYGAWYPAFSMWRSGYWKAQTSSFAEEGQNLVFKFENRENVVLDPQGNVFLRQDSTQKSLAGYVGIYLDNNGSIRNIMFSHLSPTPDIPETLMVFYDENDNVLIQESNRIAPSLLELSVPMDVRVFSPILYYADYLEGIDYFVQKVYTSPGGQVTVCRINYVPQPISPSDNAMINDNTPTFRWSSAVGAAKYELWVDDDPTFTSSEITENTSEVTYTPTEALTGESYSWKVRAYDIDNNPTDWSPVWTFTLDTIPPSAPSPASPENGAVENDLTQIFTWTQPEPDVTYWIQIDDEAGFSQPYVHENWAVTDNSYENYAFSRNGTYYWRVCARDATYNWSPWSENYELTILAPPGQPTLISPADGAMGNDNTPTFEWTPGSNADNHRLLVDDDNDFSSPEENVLLGATDGTYTIATENGLPDGSYSWKVIAINEVSENRSAVWTFTIDTVPPSVPALLAPDNGKTVRESTPTFDWSDVSDPSGLTYALEVAIDAEFNSLVIAKYDLVVSSYKPTAAEALADGTYYWRVRAIDKANNAGDFSPAWSFIVDTRV